MYVLSGGFVCYPIAVTPWMHLAHLHLPKATTYMYVISETFSVAGCVILSSHHSHLPVSKHRCSAGHATFVRPWPPLPPTLTPTPLPRGPLGSALPPPHLPHCVCCKQLPLTTHLSSSTHVYWETRCPKLKSTPQLSYQTPISDYSSLSDCTRWPTLRTSWSVSTAGEKAEHELP